MFTEHLTIHFLFMAAINFYLRGSREPKSIYLRYIPNRNNDFKVNTKLKIDSKYWSKSKKKINPNSEFPNKNILLEELDRIQSTLSTYDTQLITNKDEAKKDEVIKIVLNLNPKSDKSLLTEQITRYTERMISTKKNGEIPGAVKTYNTTKYRINKFQESKGYAVKLTGLSFDFHDEYLKFAREEHMLAENSIGKDIKNIKTVAQFAMDNDHQINLNVLSRKFKAPTEKSVFTTLSIEDLKEIEKVKGPEHIERARDWLIIGCWTACRVKDLLSLTKDNIKDLDNRKVIKYTQSKTGKRITVPILPQLERVLERLNYEFPQKISDVKFNKQIKNVCKLAKLDQEVHGSKIDPETKRKVVGKFPKWQLIRSHSCRRSFATNMYGKISNASIRAVTGHSSEKSLLIYIQENEYDHVEDILSVKL